MRWGPALAFVAIGALCGCGKSMPKEWQEFGFTTQGLMGAPTGDATSMAAAYRVAGTAGKGDTADAWSNAAPLTSGLSALYQTSLEARGFKPRCSVFREEADEGLTNRGARSGRMTRVSPTFDGIFEKDGNAITVTMHYGPSVKASDDGAVYVTVSRAAEKAAEVAKRRPDCRASGRNKN